MWPHGLVIVPPRRRRLVPAGVCRATPCQIQAWQAFKAGRHSLIAAPTGSGKTLAAFLAAIDDLAHLAEAGRLREETRIPLYLAVEGPQQRRAQNLELPL
ncbi:DEAD/DEAH box helicase, partial [Methylogaea oryzae]|uniref:DEAD/DEAH box helicase n=1 Tax=Methylogaea oryzae TaxID=1295382 RepID=UPI0020D1002B